MNTKRFAGMIVILALVTLGVLGVDRWTKDAKARQTIAPMQVASINPQLVTPTGPSSTVHFQFEPGQAPLPPIVLGKDSDPPPLPPIALPKESDPPPLISTGELEKQLKESINNLNKVLPRLAGGEESAAPPPLPPLPQESQVFGQEKKITLPQAPSILDAKDPSVPMLPAANQIGVPPSEVAPPPSPPKGLDPIAPKPLSPSFTTPPPVVENYDRGAFSKNAATISSQGDFQKRLADLEMKYLNDMIIELDRRMQQMPLSEERRKVAMDHQRYSGRLMRMMKAADMVVDRHIAQTGGVKVGMTDSPWTMHLESVDGKTVLQAIVHQKAKFKVVCDRVDLQAPRGTMLAVGHVQLSGEGFMGACERLSIPLHDDRLILEGNAEVGIRTQPMALIDERKEGVPPLVEPRKVEEQTLSAVPILHLKGDHLDLRWSDLQPTTPAYTRPDPTNHPFERGGAGGAPMIKGTPGPLVKVAFNSPANEKWSDWGTLLALPVAPGAKNAPRQYAIQNREGNILAFVRAPANMSLQEYIGKRVSVFGLPTREDGRTVMTFSVSHVAWE